MVNRLSQFDISIPSETNRLASFDVQETKSNNPYANYKDLEALKEADRYNKEIVDQNLKQVPRLTDPGKFLAGFGAAYADLPFAASDVSRFMYDNDPGARLANYVSGGRLRGVHDSVDQEWARFAGAKNREELEDAVNWGMGQNPLGYIAGGVGAAEGMAAKTLKAAPRLKELTKLENVPNLVKGFKSKYVKPAEEFNVTNVDEALDTLYGKPKLDTDIRAKDINVQSTPAGVKIETGLEAKALPDDLMMDAELEIAAMLENTKASEQQKVLSDFRDNLKYTNHPEDYKNALAAEVDKKSVLENRLKHFDPDANIEDASAGKTYNDETLYGKYGPGAVRDRLVYKTVPETENIKASESTLPLEQFGIPRDYNTRTREEVMNYAQRMVSENEEFARDFAQHADNEELKFAVQKTLMDKDLSVADDISGIMADALAGKRETARALGFSWGDLTPTQAAMTAQKLAEKNTPKLIQNQIDQVDDVLENLSKLSNEADKRSFLEGKFKGLSGTKNLIDELVLQSERGILGKDNYRKAFIDEYKLPHVDVEAQQEIKNLAEEVQKYEKGTDQRKTAEALLHKKVADTLPATLGQKMKALQDIWFLSSPTTHLVNITGNALKAGLDFGSDATSALLFDLPSSWVTGRRDYPGLKGLAGSLKAYGKGFGGGLKKGFKESALGINTSNVDKLENVQNKTIFKNKLLEGAKNTIYGSLQTMDRAFYEGRFNQVKHQLEEAAKLSKKPLSTEEIEARAMQEALEGTYQNDSFVTEKAMGLRDALNKPSDWLSKGHLKGYGAGAYTMPFVKTPTNLATSLLEYLPTGYIEPLVGNRTKKGLLSLGDNTRDLDSRFIKSRLGRATFGSLSLPLVGGALYNQGVYNPSSYEGSYEDNKKLRALNYTQGIQPQSFNVGDYNYGISRFAPISTMLDVGAVNQDLINRGVNPLSAAAQSMLKAPGGFIEMPMLQNLKGIVSTIQDAKALQRGGENAVSGAMSRLAPSGSNWLSNIGEPQLHETYDPNALKQGLNMLQDKVPGFNSGLPAKIDAFGQPAERFRTGDFIVDLLLGTSPVSITKLKKDENVNRLKDLFRETGEGSILPFDVDKNIELDGLRRDLSPEEYLELLELTGQGYKKNVVDAVFSRSDENSEDRIKAINTIKEKINADARAKLFGAVETVKNFSAPALLNKAASTKELEQLINSGADITEWLDAYMYRGSLR